MWTATALSSETQTATGKVWRVVEHQHTHSTRKLVDTQDEQQILETILEQSKPAYPEGIEHYDYLLKTPFRYRPPNPYGSRFRKAASRQGVFYAAEQLRSALAETAYYRLCFFRESTSPMLPRARQQLTAFTSMYRTGNCIDLTAPPLNKDSGRWTDMTSYTETQALAEQCREANIDVIRYQSVRDPQHGANIALLDYKAFSSDRPIDRQTWFLYIASTEVNFTRTHASDDEDYCTFQRDHFDNMPGIVA